MRGERERKEIAVITDKMTEEMDQIVVLMTESKDIVDEICEMKVNINEQVVGDYGRTVCNFERDRRYGTIPCRHIPEECRNTRRIKRSVYRIRRNRKRIYLLYREV